jgi:hypothetical protein
MMIREQPLPPLIPKSKKPVLSLTIKKKASPEPAPIPPVEELGKELGNELEAKAVIQVKSDATEKKEKKILTKKVKVVEPKDRCIARRLNNEQCPRQRTKDTEFCSAHFKKHNNGTIRDPIIEKVGNTPISKRGRKRKTEYSDKIYNNDFIAMWEHIIENEKYLMDKYGNIYTFDVEHPRYIGHQTLANKIELPKPDNP